jgi:hypothetical protein
MKAHWQVQCALAVLVIASARAQAQQQSITVTPGEKYRASPFGEKLMGTGYRELWQTPIRVPVLDLKRFAGGLVPVKEGGGRQTYTLHLRGANGRDYVFRSVDKDAEKGESPVGAIGLKGVLNASTALLHPSGALIVPPLLDAVSVLHVSPRLVYMPPEADLGEFTSTFAGTLGLLEERPEEGDDGAAGFSGSRSIVGTDKLKELLRKDSRNRIDERDWLTARLVDFVIGDTDRGPNQWRWARFDDGDGFRWRPVPRDRDFAFIHADGLLPRAAGLIVKRLVTYEDELPPLGSLTFSSLYVDRPFLQSLDAAAWALIAENVEMKLSDPVIDAAVRSLPREHYAVNGPRTTAKLRTRRAELREIARQFYRQLATHVDVEGSDANELAEIRRYEDGSVDVMVYRRTPDLVAAIGNGYDLARTRRAFYIRRFLPTETEEVRVYLYGGDDRAVVVGVNTENAISVRVIGGEGSDELVDASAAGRGGTHTWFYDDRADNRLTRGKHTHVDHRGFTPPPNSAEVGINGMKKRFRDWGETRGFGPAVDYRANTGLILGVQYHNRKYGFRRVPFEADWRANLMWAPQTGDFGAGLEIEHHLENSHWSVAGEVRGSQYDNLRFFGYGNNTPDIDSDSSRVEWDLGQALGGFRYESGDVEFGLGVLMQVSDTPLEPGTPLSAEEPMGIGGWTQVGVWSEVQVGIGNNATFGVDATAYPAAASLAEPYAKAGATATVYIGNAPTLALRAIGEKHFGEAPWFDAAFIGGRKMLRGYSSYRFAGDAALVGNAELRFPFAQQRLGVLLLADAGRVYFESESPGGWHTAYGAGFWISAGGHTIAGTYANGEDHKFYVTLGHTF